VTKKLIVDIDDKLDENFRKIIAKKFGLHHGAIKKALVEAIMDWNRRNK